VTGGTGFVGSYLIPLLLEKEHDVWDLQRYVTGRIGGFRKTKTVYADLTDDFSVRRAIRAAKPDAIVHMRARN
jgi:nucleoside-diphosphate-sugar epimerase